MGDVPEWAKNDAQHPEREAEWDALRARAEAIRSRLSNVVDEHVRPMPVLTAEEALGVLERELPAQRIASAREVAAERARAEAAEGALAALHAAHAAKVLAEAAAIEAERGRTDVARSVGGRRAYLFPEYNAAKEASLDAFDAQKRAQAAFAAALSGPAATIAAEHDRRVRAEALEAAAGRLRFLCRDIDSTADSIVDALRWDAKALRGGA